MLRDISFYVEIIYKISKYRDVSRCYIFFLYLQGCSPPKCKVYLNYVMKNFPVPGILCGDYYR